MKPGDKVVCVLTEFNFYRGEQTPVKGEIYTVRDIYEVEGVIGIRLHEILNIKRYYSDGLVECGFALYNFRPIDYTYGTEVCEKLEKELSETLIPESV